MIKKIVTVSLLTAASGLVMAQDNALQAYGLTFSGAATLASDYRFRGQSQTENDPALQGTFTLTHTSGLYFNVFASSVDLPLSNGKSAHLELDPTLGFTTPITLGQIKPNLDVGVAYYNYPSASDLNYPEFYAKISFADAMIKGDVLTPSISYSYKYGGTATSDVMGDDVSNWNFNLAYSAPFADTGFGGVASVGYTKANQNIYGNDDNFVDWKAGVTYGFKSVNGLTAELDAVGSTIDGYTGAANRAVDAGAMFSLTKTF
ncbi:TorF family putative porin [Acinetobacter boissieri]|uniref:MetA-pathway of phenol degradation n=1 Tax=Acinetobacter boissieri TaxID=1219383 RepID=A0A1G6HN40_9GAMM|nr:TorF family putative porin [Acinetobacter boissieri]SDB95305.1 conserved hypothetical protein [Acinetobacter boissieri]